MRILVTGAAGFIGSALTKHLLMSGHSVRAIDSYDDLLYSASVKKSRAQGLRRQFGLDVYETDLLVNPDLESLLSDIDLVINEAAIPGLTSSWSNVYQYMNSNAVLVSRLLGAMRPGSKFIQASTSSVYGIRAQGDESEPLDPVSPYGVSKLAGEQLLQITAPQHNIEFMILRYFSVYGPGQRPDMAYSQIIESLLSGREITIFGTGHQTRSNCYIDDVVLATAACLGNWHSGEVFNIAGSDSISLLDAIGILGDELGVVPKVNFSPAKDGDQISTRGSIAKAEEKLKWSPKINAAEGLRLQARAAKAAMHIERTRG